MFVQEYMYNGLSNKLRTTIEEIGFSIIVDNKKIDKILNNKDLKLLNTLYKKQNANVVFKSYILNDQYIIDVKLFDDEIILVNNYITNNKDNVIIITIAASMLLYLFFFILLLLEN